MKSAKYLLAYLVPAIAIWSLFQEGIGAFAVVIFAFVLVPLVEQVLPRLDSNLSEAEKESHLKDRLFDYLLYLNLPIVYGTVLLFIYQLNHTTTMSTATLLGHILSVGIVLGACGINVGHELGHRNNKVEQFIAKALLLPSLYQHFFIEHNRGHHKWVATPQDPASSRRGETIYAFWFRSLTQSYRHAWQLEAEKLRKQGLPFWSGQNLMIRFTLVQISYISVVFLLTAEWQFALFVLLAGLVGALLLESINYIEHYGLVREKMSNGRYERVQPHHSWNSNFYLGRIILYELTRHSDHHFLANKKYQVLDHHDQAPELPYGYPASVLLALLPPLWFSIMDARLDKEHLRLATK
ncbi:MAG: alkane 1-monooxygenase [Bacteroidetes bacterium]|nr:MAG: alkane 1-monooxygenase [Bacteroidota bacterium]